MLERLKKALVESFVGAIALGYVFAQGILHFAWVFAAPIAGYVSQREYQAMMGRATASSSLEAALLELARSVALLAVGYILLRWLYFKPLAEEARDTAQEQPS